jgi:hypothetical protein
MIVSVPRMCHLLNPFGTSPIVASASFVQDVIAKAFVVVDQEGNLCRASVNSASCIFNICGSGPLSIKAHSKIYCLADRKGF